MQNIPDKTFCDSIKTFQKSLNTKMRIENKSKNTITSYNTTYKAFILFCKQHYKQLSFSNIVEDDIYAFIEYKSEMMNKQGELAVSSVNAIVSHLKRLFKHIESNSGKLYDFDKVFEDIKPKQEQRIPKGVSDADFKKLEGRLEEMKIDEVLINFRNITLMKFLMYGGLRASEAISISLSDITYEEADKLYKISFRGKGRKIRTTFIEKELLEDELEMLSGVFNIDADKVIALTSTGNQMDRVQLSKMANSIYKQAGIKITGLHVLRHTVAKRLLARGVSIVVVQSLLGHGSIQTTAIYTNPTEDIIKGELGR